MPGSSTVSRSEWTGGPPSSGSTRVSSSFRWTLGETPEAVQVIGRSDARETYHVFYHDDRGVGRIFAMEFDGKRWTLLREDPDFHQRFTADIDGDRIQAAAEASEDHGANWRKDFDLTFTRKSPST